MRQQPVERHQGGEEEQAALRPAQHRRDRGRHEGDQQHRHDVSRSDGGGRAGDDRHNSADRQSVAFQFGAEARRHGAHGTTARIPAGAGGLIGPEERRALHVGWRTAPEQIEDRRRHVEG